MAVYDGFFDAVANEETGEFDRAYGSGNFTDYFAHIIGSGVCIHNAPDSFKVRFENGAAVVSPGYLFIEGYWLKNDEDYTISVTGDATLAIVAHLNLGRRMIELKARSVAQAYPDSLVLALVNPAAGTAEDTRHNTDICGTIDTAGELSQKVEWAVNYIDNEIEDKLAAAEADIAEQSKKLDAKIAEVQAQVDKITPPPVGSIKFSASEDVGPGWLPCNGDFISESQYPDLVAALGKLTPSGDKFKLISDGEIGPQISNGVVYGGRMWVYSYSTQKLYGVDVDGVTAVKEISVTSENEFFSNFIAPTTKFPLCLSIVPHKAGTGAKLFLAQLLEDISSMAEGQSWLNSFLFFQSEFTGEETSLIVTPPLDSFPDLGQYSLDLSIFAPYIASISRSGKEKYLCAIGEHIKDSKLYNAYIEFSDDGCELKYSEILNIAYSSEQFAGFRDRDKSECVFVLHYSNYYNIISLPAGIFNSLRGPSVSLSAKSKMSMNIVGRQKVIAGFTLNNFPWFSVDGISGISIHNIKLPNAAQIFFDAGVYLWGKDIYMIFVGTGIIFSRTLEEGSFGYLDTTSVLGTITQFGYLDYSQDEGTLYIVGQDTTNRVKVAKIVLNTLYDYANDGAWLPMIAADGVPAWIKAVGENDSGNITDPVDMNITVSSIGQYVDILFNGGVLLTTGSYKRTVSASGTFTVGLRANTIVAAGYAELKLNNSTVVRVPLNKIGEEKTATLKTSDYISDGITLSVN